MCKVYKLFLIVSFSYCQSETRKAHKIHWNSQYCFNTYRNVIGNLISIKEFLFLLVNPLKWGSCIYSAGAPKLGRTVFFKLSLKLSHVNTFDTLLNFYETKLKATITRKQVWETLNASYWQVHYRSFVVWWKGRWSVDQTSYQPHHII